MTTPVTFTMRAVLIVEHGRLTSNAVQEGLQQGAAACPEVTVGRVEVGRAVDVLAVYCEFSGDEDALDETTIQRWWLMSLLEMESSGNGVEMGCEYAHATRNPG